MKKEKTIREIIAEVNKVVDKMPTLKESLSLYDDVDDYTSEEPEERVSKKSFSDDTEPSLSNPGVSLVDKIRKMALQGMTDLADNTENPDYVVLKKIWQLAEKSVEPQKENEKNI